MNLTVLAILFSILITSASAQDTVVVQILGRKNVLMGSNYFSSNNVEITTRQNLPVKDWEVTWLNIQNAYNTFFIGGNDIAREGDWKWQNGTDVIMIGEVGYQNWKYNQPNGGTGKNCLTVGRETYEWVDISLFPGPFVRIQTINGNQKNCSATDCSTATQAECYKSSSKVSTATTMAGNPTIHQISNTVCNSDLVVSWKPHTNAVGFRHKIEVSPTSGESTRWVDSPTSEKQSTTITNLSPTSTFLIKKTACVTKVNCPTKYSTIRSARKDGSTLSVESSSIIQYKNTQTCVISWILYNKTETGDSYTVELNLTSTPVSSQDANSEIDTKLIEVTSSSGYSFQPEPNRNYSVSIKIFNCYWSVIGSCVGNPKEKKSFELNIVSFVIGFLIPLIFYVIFGLIIYRLINKIKKLKKHAEAKEHNYENIQEKGATPSNDPVSQPSYSNVLQETVGYDQALPAPTKQTQVESAYDQLSSSNVLQEAAGYEQALPAPTKQRQVESAYEQPSSSNVLQEAV
ncbi:uncharacterized protein LOC144425196 [Styela clava]